MLVEARRSDPTANFVVYPQVHSCSAVGQCLTHIDTLPFPQLRARIMMFPDSGPSQGVRTKPSEPNSQNLYTNAGMTNLLIKTCAPGHSETVRLTNQMLALVRRCGVVAHTCAKAWQCFEPQKDDVISGI